MIERSAKGYDLKINNRVDEDAADDCRHSGLLGIGK